MTLGERVRDRRKAAGLNQAELAALVGVSQAAVSDWEKGKATPSIGGAGALAKALGVELSWLVYGDEEPVAAEPAAPPAEGAA